MITSNNDITLVKATQLAVRQIFEISELLGYETRNKYEIVDSNRSQVAFAAEQGNGFFNFVIRQYLGHWRAFDVSFFTPQKQLFMIAHHPFRWFFQRIEVRDAGGRALGAIQKRFSFFSKRFDVESASGSVLLEVSSPIWKIWSFSFTRHGRQFAAVKKKWSGIMSEVFTDKDNFLIEFSDPTMSEDERRLILAAAIFIDLLYFEKKAS